MHNLDATNNGLDQAEEEKLVIFTVSDEELEKAAGGTTSTYPGTGVATICKGTEDEAWRLGADIAKFHPPQWETSK